MTVCSAGQGTMGLEVLDQVPDLDASVIPVGGGGLIAGDNRYRSYSKKEKSKRSSFSYIFIFHTSTAMAQYDRSKAVFIK